MSEHEGELERSRLREEGIESREKAAAALEKSSLQHQDSLDKREVFLASRQAETDRSLATLREREEEIMDRTIVVADQERAVQTAAEQNKIEAARLVADREALDADRATAADHFNAERESLAREREDVELQRMQLEDRMVAALTKLGARKDAAAAAEAGARDRMQAAAAREAAAKVACEEREAAAAAREAAAKVACEEREAAAAAREAAAREKTSTMEQVLCERENECHAKTARLIASKKEWQTERQRHDETLQLWKEDVDGYVILRLGEWLRVATD